MQTCSRKAKQQYGRRSSLSHPLCLKSELDHFSLPPVQTAIETAKYVNYNPVNNNFTSDTIAWDITGTPDESIDLAHSTLLIDVTFKTNAGLDVDSGTAACGPVNLLSRSLFCGHELLINGEPVSSVPALSHYTAYFEHLLNYDGYLARNQLHDAGFMLDDNNNFDSAIVSIPDPNPLRLKMNSGIMLRRLRVMDGRVWRMYCKFPSDLANQQLFIPPRLDLKLTLTRSKESFAMLNVIDAAPDAKIVILNAALRIKKLKMDANFLLAHEMLLQKRNAVIPFVESGCLEMTIPQGSSTWTRDDVFRGAIPKKIVVGFVDSRAVGGCWNRNPYKFDHLNISQIVTYVNSEPIPSKPLQLAPAAENFRDGILSLLETSGTLHKNASLPFDHSNWAGGYGLFGFNLEPDVGDGSCINPVKKGVLGINCTFSVPTPATYSVIIYFNKNGLVEIDQRRNIYCPYRRM